MFLDALADRISQGDVFDDIVTEDGFSEASRQPSRVILLTNDCDIDKRSFDVWLTVRLTPLSSLTGPAKGVAGDILRDRVPAALYVPASRSIPESFVDYRHIYRVRRDSITEAAASGRRVASMSEDGRVALGRRLIVFLRRKQRPKQPGESAPPVGMADPDAEHGL